MRETVKVTGVVIYAQVVGEYDKRLIVLTGERGKITVFAHGVRRGRSPFAALCNLFAFARFTLYEGRDAYTLSSAEAIDYFDKLFALIPEAFYGQYFLEFASYYGREGIEAYETVNLIYVALKALIIGKMEPELIRAVYEIRLLSINGEYAVPEEDEIGDKAAFHALRHIASSNMSSLFSFEVPQKSRRILIGHAKKCVSIGVDYTFKSLEVISEMK